MPNENDVIYCMCVNETGHILNTSMLTRQTAEHNLKLFKESEAPCL